MHLISQSQVEQLLPVSDCVEVMRKAMIAVSRGQAAQPIRQFMPIPGAPGKLAIMPGAMGDAGEAQDACFGIKLVCKYDRPRGDPLGTHVGFVLLFDSVKGVPLALVEGSSLTAIRTSAASALATDALAREDATTLAIIGTGEQARRHIPAMAAVRPIESIHVWGRDKDNATAFAKDAERAFGLPVEAYDSVTAAVDGADIICTATSAREPVLSGADLQPGQHINLVGSAIPTTAEIDAAGVARSRFFVDYRPAAMAAAGELLMAIAGGVVDESHIVGEIGEVLIGSVVGRQSAQDITCYKSLGVSAQDLAAAREIWSRALASDCAATFDLWS
jgi:ornithine cyclodeaminase/alanine dehydrogenase-like protein (mu-crystallin family)